MKKRYLFLVAISLLILTILSTYKVIAVKLLQNVVAKYDIKIDEIEPISLSSLRLMGVKYKDKKLLDTLDIDYDILAIAKRVVKIKNLTLNSLDLNVLKKLYEQNFSKTRGKKENFFYRIDIAKISIDEYRYKDILLKDIKVTLKNTSSKKKKIDISDLSFKIKRENKLFHIYKAKGKLKFKKEYTLFLDAFLDTNLAKSIPITLKLNFTNKGADYDIEAYVDKIHIEDKIVSKLLKNLKIDIKNRVIKVKNKKLNIKLIIDKHYNKAKFTIKTKSLLLKDLFGNKIDKDISTIAFKIKADGIYDIKNSLLDMDYKISSKFLNIDGNYKNDQNSTLFVATLPKNRKKYLKRCDIEKLFPIKMKYDIKNRELNLKNMLLDANLSYKNDIFKAKIGIDDVAAIFLKRNKNDPLKFSIKTNSLKNLLKSIGFFCKSIPKIKHDTSISIDGSLNGKSIGFATKVYDTIFSSLVILSKKDISLKTDLVSNLSLKRDIDVDHLSIKAKYNIKKRTFVANIYTILQTPKIKDLSISSKFVYLFGKNRYKISGYVDDYVLNLDNDLAKYLQGGDIKFHIKNGNLKATFSNDFFDAVYSAKVKDFQKGYIEIKSHRVVLGKFIDVKMFENESFYLSARSKVDLFDINSSVFDIRAYSDIAELSGKLYLNQNSLKAIVDAPTNITLYKKYKNLNLKNLFPLDMNIKKIGDIFEFEIKKQTCIDIKITKDTKEDKLKLNMKVFNFRLKATKNDDQIRYSCKVDSILAFKNALTKIYAIPKFEVDANVELKGVFRSGMAYFVINMPWFLYRYDIDKYFFTKDSSLKLIYKNGVLLIKSYKTFPYILEKYRKIFSKKVSSYILDEHKLELNINDKMILKGNIGSDIDLLLTANGYHIKEPEADAVVDIDISFLKDKNTTSLKGVVKLVNGTIKYKPKNSYIVEDKDIIFVDHKSSFKQSGKKFDILLNIVSSNSLQYINNDNKILFTNDITIFKKGVNKREFFGYIHILNGVYYGSGKRFDLKKGEIIFDGNMLNPFLNLKATYKKDPYTITIYIGGKLGSPVINFSSVPYLSRADILSLMLFNTTFSNDKKFSSSQALEVFGNSFAKGIVNSLGLNFSNVQIVSSEEGSFGFILEKQLSKRLSIIYKEDATKSIKIRYKNTKHIQSDFSFSPESTGVEIYYKK